MINPVGILRNVLEILAVERAGAALAMMFADFENWVVGMIVVKRVDFDFVAVVVVVVVVAVVVVAVVAEAVVVAAAVAFAEIDVVAVFAVAVAAVGVVVVGFAVVGIPSFPFC